MSERIATALAPGVLGEWSGNGERPGGHTIPPPRADEKMFCGVVGTVARLAAKGGEVSPVAPLMAGLSWVSAQAGGDPYIQIGNVRHPVAINVLHVGRAMWAANTESVALLLTTESEIRDGGNCGSDALLGQRRRGGLSRPEDIVLLVHDGYQDIPPVDDKRLWLCELPLAPRLRRMKRGGDAVSEALIDFFDGGSIRMMTRTGSLSATSPHIAVHATITPAEFQSMLDQSVIHQGHGLASRFLIFWAERIDTVPVPVPTNAKTIKAMANALHTVVKFARGEYPRTRDNRAVQLSPEARELYETFYPSLRGLDSWGGIGTGLLQRLAPITMRIAAVYALADLSLVRPCDPAQTHGSSSCLRGISPGLGAVRARWGSRSAAASRRSRPASGEDPGDPGPCRGLGRSRGDRWPSLP